MKKKNISKKLVAVILSVVMIATSIPFMIIGNAAGGDYDPAPFFDDTAREEGARAWLDDDGNIQVAFPSAIARPTFKGEELQIEFYILELTDLGPKNTVHTDIVLDTIKIPATKTRAKDNFATFVVDPAWNIDLNTNRYNVEITAVDEQNWFSESLHTSVTDVPEAYIDADNVTSFVESATAVREIMTFDDGTDDGVATGNALKYTGVVAQGGTQNTAGTSDTSALRFIMYESPSGLQTFDTSYSRQTWDFDGAEEVWVWMDLEGVELTGLSFRLRTQEYTYEDWNNDSKFEEYKNPGDIIYSTRGTASPTYTGEDPYVYIQQEDGTWKKTMLNENGTLDVGNMVGYIRVPLKFICSETDSYVDVSNQDLGQGHNFKNGLFSGYSIKQDEIYNWLNSLIFAPVLVDPAGTPISDALLIHRRVYSSYSGVANAGTRHFIMFDYANGITHQKDDTTFRYEKIGHMLAAGLGKDAAKTSVTTGGASTDRAYIANGLVQNRAAGLTALNDIRTFGFSFDGCSSDSLKEDFYLDNVFFYRTDGGAYSENTLDGNPNTGDPLSSYFDEELELAKIIFKEIDKYITNPDWADYREVHYILDFIDGYKSAYAEKYPNKSTAFLGVEAPGSGTGLAACSAAVGDTAWDRFWEAYQECLNQGTLATANTESYELLPLLVNTLEKMPRAADIKSVSNILRLEIIKVWRAYSLLNLGQLKMLGAAEEREIVRLISLLENFDEGTADEFVVGDALANYPYIVFNDFENQTTGDRGWQVENDNNAFTTAVGGTSNLANDWRHLKGLTTYTVNGEDVPSTVIPSYPITDKDYLGYVTTDEDKQHEALDGKVHYDAAYAEITSNGYLNSKAATMNIESSYTTSDNHGTFHAITITKDGRDFNTYTEMEAYNMGVDDNLGQLNTANAKDKSLEMGLSLIFYVDFSEVSNFYFVTNVFTKNSDGTYVKGRVDLGALQADRKYWILDPNTGEWEKCESKNEWCFPSNSASVNTGITLDGYKGYLMVPLYHTKGDDKLDSSADLLNNIYAVQFAVGGANEDSLYGKSYTIDNVGFTYQPTNYDVDYGYPTYAEVFDAKSTSAYTFEQYVNGDTIYEKEIELQDSVDADGNPIQVEVVVDVPYPGIDIYDEVTRAERIEKAKQMYEALPDYQKGVVRTAYETLIEYVKISDGTTALPDPVYTPAQLNELVAQLPEATRNAAVSGVDSTTGANFDLTYPGFLVSQDENGRDVYSVNYAEYGLDADKAQEIIDWYNTSYAYYSKEEKASVNAVEFLNAYRAAMRTKQSLETIMGEVNTIAPQVSDLYTPVFDADGNRISSFVQISERQEVGDFYTKQYLPISYYAKTSLANGQLQKVYQNASRGLTYFLKNTETYSIDGETVEGGIITLQKKMQAAYDMAKDHIDNKTLFVKDDVTGVDELQYLKDLIAEYNALLPAYYNVKELYDLEQQILALFPVEAHADVDVKDIILSEDALTNGSSTFKVEYSEILDYDESGDKYFVRITSENGALVNDYGDNIAYTLDINGTAKDPSTMVAGNPFTEDVLNNTYTPDAPLNYVLTPSLSAKPQGISGAIRDNVKVELIYLENKTTTDADGNETVTPVETVVYEQLVTVSYSMGDEYVVEFPGGFPVEWDSTEKIDVSYTVTTNMVATSSIDVGVQSDGTGKMTNADSEHTLEYTTENFKVENFGYNVTEAKPTDTPYVTVSGWDSAPVGEYRTTLTYAVTYNKNADSTS